MMKILCFGASTSSKSINHQLSLYTGSLLDKAEIIPLDLNYYEMPIYSEDRQAADGIPDEALAFRSLLQEIDAVIISLAEHNGTYTTAFKNLIDWNSVIGGKAWEDKPFLLLATSSGPRGGMTGLQIALDKWPYMGADIKASFSLPSFQDNFRQGVGIIDKELSERHLEAVNLFKKEISY